MPALEITRSSDAEQDLLDNTLRMNQAVDAFIRKDPSQWVWMHERFKTMPGEEII
jgi:KDO2-lipid IV(A) lauroyltransferase